MMQRVYAGTVGLSHVEDIELNAQSVLEKVRGHTTANVGKEPRVSLQLQFEDQRQVIGPLGNKK